MLPVSGGLSSAARREPSSLSAEGPGQWCQEAGRPCPRHSRHGPATCLQSRGGPDIPNFVPKGPFHQGGQLRQQLGLRSLPKGRGRGEPCGMHGLEGGHEPSRRPDPELETSPGD